MYCVWVLFFRKNHWIVSLIHLILFQKSSMTKWKMMVRQDETWFLQDDG